MGGACQHPAPALSPAYPACPVHWLIIQPRADHAEGGHDSNHSYAADHAPRPGPPASCPPGATVGTYRLLTPVAALHPPTWYHLTISAPGGWKTWECGAEEAPPATPPTPSPLSFRVYCRLFHSCWTQKPGSWPEGRARALSLLRCPVCHHAPASLCRVQVETCGYDADLDRQKERRQEPPTTPVCGGGHRCPQSLTHALLHPGLGRGKGGQLSGRANHDPGHGPTHCPATALPGPAAARWSPRRPRGSVGRGHGVSGQPVPVQEPIQPAQLGELSGDGPYLVMVLVPHGHCGHRLGLQLRFDLCVQR